MEEDKETNTSTSTPWWHIKTSTVHYIGAGISIAIAATCIAGIFVVLSENAEDGGVV